MYIRQGLKTFTISVIFLLTLSPGFAQEYRYIPLDAAAVYEEKVLICFICRHISGQTLSSKECMEKLCTHSGHTGEISTP